MFELYLKEPHTSGMDDLFFELFGSYPKVNIPTDVEDLMDFKNRIEDFLSVPGNKFYSNLIIRDVDVNKSYTVHSVEDFDLNLQILQEYQKTQTPELPEPGISWKITNDIVGYVDPYDIVDDMQQVQEISADLEMRDVLPDSKFSGDSKLGNLNLQSNLGKDGEAFPAINESSKLVNEDGSFTDEMLEAIDELSLNENTTDEQLLAFISKGLDGLKSAGSGILGAAKKVSDASGATEIVKAGRDRAVKDIKEKGKKGWDRLTGKAWIQDMIDNAKDKLENVNVEKVAKDLIADKKNTKAIKEKDEALKFASNASKAIRDKDGDPKKITDAKEKLQDDIQQAKKELKDSK